jgi:hypothetical protein
MFNNLRRLLASKFHVKNRLIQVSREITNKIFQNLNHDEEILLPGFYYYAGLQIEVKFFSSYSTFLGKNLEYWDWAVYDGFGQGMLNAGVADTENDATAIAKNWAIEFLEGRVLYKSNFRYDSTTRV